MWGFGYYKIVWVCGGYSYYGIVILFVKFDDLDVLMYSGCSKYIIEMFYG